MVICVVVILLVVILLAAKVLSSRLFIYTFDPVKVILPLVVIYWPAKFVIVLAAITLSTKTAPVEKVPPVLSISTFEALKRVRLLAINLVSTLSCVIARAVVVKFVALIVSANI